MTPPTPSDYSDDRLLAFLRQKLAGEPLPAAAAPHFHDADIYAADPATLTSVHDPAPAKKGDGDSWFFFTHLKTKSSRDTRKSRQIAGGVGTWHSERAPRAVFDDEGKCIGHFQYFSYKIKTGKNCSERTQWYMMEFSDDNQEGNHDRIHGGEPVLVLCKIYKAHHSNCRSSTSSKRKPTNELLDQATFPSKAKRRLFDSPVPISSSVAASHEPVSSKPCYELATQLKYFHSGIESKPSQDEVELEAPHELVRSYQLSSRLQSFCRGLVPKPLQDEEAKHEELETSQEKLSSRTSYKQLQCKSNDTLDSAFRSELEPSLDKESIIQRFWTNVTEELEASQEKLLLDKSNATLDSAFRSELEPSQDKVSESTIQRFWTEVETEATVEPEGSHDKLLQGKSNTTLDCAFRFELEQSQDKVNESIIQRFWTSETEASRVDKATMNCSFLLADGALPMPAHCAPEVVLTSSIGNDITSSYSREPGWFISSAPPMPAHSAPAALSSASWIGNDITASCSSELGRVVGAPTYNELGGIAGGGFTGKLEVHSIPFALVPPAAAASWFFSGPDLIF